MVRRIITLTANDLRLAVRNRFLAVVTVVALLYVAAIHWLIPADLSLNPLVVVWDRTGGRQISNMYENSDKAVTVDSEEAYRVALAGTNRVGLVFSGSDEPASVEVAFAGYENSRVRQLFLASLQADVAQLTGAARPAFTTVVLRPGADARPQFNLSLVPFFVFSEAGLIGMLLIAALLFMEKDERTVKAFRVSPGRTIEFLLAKAIAMGVLALVFTVILTLLTVGVGINWPATLAVVFLAAVVTSIIALLLANLFTAINQVLFPMMGLIGILSMPAVSYFVPSFSPWFLRILPTYPLLFTLRSAYFAPASSGPALATACSQLALTLLIVLPLASIAFERQLIRGDN